jgi:hypothetical protein
VLLVCVGTSSFCIQPQSAYADAGMCGVAEQAMQAATKIRQLSPDRPVPCVVRSRSEVETFLKDVIAEKFPRDTLEMEQLVYRAIGLVPDEYDYAQGIVEAYVQQIGGYYDPDKKLFVMLSSMPEKLRPPVAVHELTHALQDQRFDLNRFLDPAIHNNDQLMARAALVEGDASLVMQEFMRGRGGSSGGVEPQTPSSEQAVAVPPALQRVLLFPYIQGLSFARRVARDVGYSALNEAFQRPPKSSREVLHPEEFISRSFEPGELSADLVEQPVARSSREYEDTIGEFVIAALLGDALGSERRGEECAQGWRRDRVAVLKGEMGQRFVSWMSEWDSVEEAAQFFECYREMLKVRYKRDVHSERISVSAKKRVSVAHGERRVSVVIEVVP